MRRREALGLGTTNMPQFQLNSHHSFGSSHPYFALSTFAKGYVEAMFFTNGDIGDDTRDDLLNELGTQRLTREAIAEIAKDCEQFLAIKSGSDGTHRAWTVRQWLDAVHSRGGVDYDEAQAGRDLWFTRQGHGAGFWDREQLTKGEGTFFTRAADTLGMAYVEVSRGWIYHRSSTPHERYVVDLDQRMAKAGYPRKD